MSFEGVTLSFLECFKSIGKSPGIGFSRPFFFAGPDMFTTRIMGGATERARCSQPRRCTAGVQETGLGLLPVGNGRGIAALPTLHGREP